MPGYPTSRTPGSLLPYHLAAGLLGQLLPPFPAAWQTAQLSAGCYPKIARPMWLGWSGTLLICEAAPGQVASDCCCAKAVF